MMQKRRFARESPSHVLNAHRMTITSASKLARLPLWIVRVLAPVAAVVAGYLFSIGSGSSVVGCEGFESFDCSAALSSRWSVWLSMPISLLGLACYVAVAIGAWLIGRRSLTADAAGWRILELFTPAMLGAAAWFVGLQVTGASPACLHCLIVHTCGVTIAIFVLVQRRQAAGDGRRGPAAPLMPIAQSSATTSIGRESPPPPALGLPTLAGIAGVAALVLVQLMLPPRMNVIDVASIEGDLSLTLTDAELGETDLESSPADLFSSESTESDNAASSGEDEGAPSVGEQSVATSRRGEGSRIVEVMGGKLKFDAYDYPLLGSPEAEYVIIEMMNYGCPNCREFHKLLEKARPRYGDQLAIVVLPVPGEILCNKYIKKANPKASGTCNLAKLAVAVSTVAPEKFEQLHNFMLKGKRMPTFTRATIFAKEIADPNRVSFELQSPRPLNQVKAYIELFAKLSQAKPLHFPSQIVGDQILEGLPASADTLCQAWEDRLGIRPIAGEES